MDLDKDTALKEREKRIKREITRLRKIYQDVPPRHKAAIDGLIKRAAYMRICLEDMEADLAENGYVEMFSQSPNVPPYERERPVARLYNNLNKSYQSIVKQLSDILKIEPPPKEEEDGFEDFINSRD